MRRKINLNGSSQESLIADYRKTLDALNEALENFSKVMPHGRDYQINEHPQEDYEEDRKEHLVNVAKMHDVRHYIHNCILSIGTQ